MNSLDAWVNSKNTEGFFGLDRNPHIDLPNGFTVVPDAHICDWRRRTWFERLFERNPWRPFVKREREDKALIVDKLIIVSWKTYNRMREVIK